MSWYEGQFATDDIATGKHIDLQNRFETLFYEMHEPAGAAMFVNGNARDDYTYYCLQLGGAKPPPLGGSFSRFSIDSGA